MKLRQVYLPLVPEGTDYRVRAISLWDPMLEDESDQPFAIHGGPLRVFMPNGGDTWQSGAQEPVWWKANPYYAGTARAVGTARRGGAKVADLGLDWAADGEGVILHPRVGGGGC